MGADFWDPLGYRFFSSLIVKKIKLKQKVYVNLRKFLIFFVKQKIFIYAYEDQRLHIIFLVIDQALPQFSATYNTFKNISYSTKHSYLMSMKTEGLRKFFWPPPPIWLRKIREFLSDFNVHILLFQDFFEPFFSVKIFEI